jgi:hypothetical protein
MTNRIVSFFVIMTFIAASCSKTEGPGGDSAIKGKVMLKEYNETFKQLIDVKPAADENVYIIYGNDNFIGDKVTADNEGNFMFEYLQAGNYKILIYTEDTSGISTGNKIPVIKEVKVGDGKTADIGTVYKCKALKFDDGSSMIVGKIFIKEYDEDFAFLQRIIPAANENVYILNNFEDYVSDNLSSSFDGSFRFANLLQGTYKIVIYTEDSTKAVVGNKDTIIRTVSVGNGQTVDLGTLYKFKTLKIDDGTSMITGKVTLINYMNNGADIKDISFAQEQDIYLIYNDHKTFDLRSRTNYDGVFQFPYLIKGKYTVYIYSENINGATQRFAHKKDVLITEDYQEVMLTDTIEKL